MGWFYTLELILMFEPLLLLIVPRDGDYTELPVKTESDVPFRSHVADVHNHGAPMFVVT